MLGRIPQIRRGRLQKRKKRPYRSWKFEHPARDCYDKINLIIAIIGLLILAAYTGVSGYQAWLSRRQLAEIQAVPKIRVSDIDIWMKGRGQIYGDHNVEPTDWTPGTRIEGVVFGVNSGRGFAHVTYSDAYFYWRKGNLPLTHPYWHNESINPSAANKIQLYNTSLQSFTPLHGGGLKAGESGVWRLPETTIIPGKDLYVMGTITIMDDTGRWSSTLFARRYDRMRNRFLASDNADYDGE